MNRARIMEGMSLSGFIRRNDTYEDMFGQVWFVLKRVWLCGVLNVAPDT